MDALYWLLVAFIVTIPRGSKGCRTWMILFLLGVVAFVVAFQLSDAEVPDFSSLGLGSGFPFLTEHELVLAVQRVVPFVLMLLVALSEYYFVNTESMTAEVLQSILRSQKVQ